MRTEIDSMGAMAVPDDALYGASTQRAVLNFPISGHRLPPPFIRTLALVKIACAAANEELGLLAVEKSRAIQLAAGEVHRGEWSDQFPLDVFQTGSATSANMNMNEVIANLASRHAGQAIGSRNPLHPNDDVNLGQSSNDIIPTTLHVSVAQALDESLIPALRRLAAALEVRSAQWSQIVKIGRTHLMDATPLTLGQEFSGYARQAAKAAERCTRAVEALGELAVGGTAVGTGINTDPHFGAVVARILSERTGLSFREANNHFEAQAGRDDCVEVAGQLSAVAASLTKIANDVRWLGSGPRAGLAELKLPATQPGSSIMPGKVNPVMSEMLVQVGLYVQGLTQTVQLCGREGQFELNVTLPLMAHCLHEAVRCLANGVNTFTEKCIEGLEADPQRCRELVDRSLMLVTALNPHIGYDAAASVAKEAHATGKSLRAVVIERGLMSETAVDAALDPTTMTQPGMSSLGGGGG